MKIFNQNGGRLKQEGRWVISFFAFLCLEQVTNWLEDIFETSLYNEKHFNWRGTAYTVLPNRSFIVDESLRIYGIQVNHLLN